MCHRYTGRGRGTRIAIRLAVATTDGLVDCGAGLRFETTASAAIAAAGARTILIEASKGWAIKIAKACLRSITALALTFYRYANGVRFAFATVGFVVTAAHRRVDLTVEFIATHRFLFANAQSIRRAAEYVFTKLGRETIAVKAARSLRAAVGAHTTILAASAGETAHRQ